MLSRLALILAALFAATAAVAAPPLASTPPMGWNSWDAYGMTVDEGPFRANAEALKGLKGLGWRYVVIDEGWYMADPSGDRLQTRHYVLDAYGRLIPAPARFASSAGGRGFKPLADWTHAQGLKFGIHIIRGIPKAAVDANLPIEGSAFRAADGADRAALCGWDDGNYGVADNAAGQAYYDSIFRLYAAWGVDFVKVDCIADHPYRITEIRQIAEAIRRSGRPMVLSLSPGPTNLTHAEEIARYAQMWRIANDTWDYWTSDHDKPLADVYPTGLRVAFDDLEAWAGRARPGAWPDADMLPIGSLTPHPGWGAARKSSLTADEQRTLISLWSIARSPLFVGANLTEMDAATRALLSNREVIALDQRPGEGRPLASLPAGLEEARVWLSTPKGAAHPDTVAVFNVGDRPLSVDVPWAGLGLPPGPHAARDLWTGARLPRAPRVHLTIPAHGVALLRVR